MVSSLNTVQSELEFHPIAIYSPRCDTIRVLLEDCYFKERKINPYWTALETNLKLVGFDINNVRELTTRLGYYTIGTVKLSNLLKRIEDDCPKELVQILKNDVYDILKECDLKINFKNT